MGNTDMELAENVAKEAVREIEKERSFAWELIANARRDSKRWFIALIVALCMWFGTIGIFIGVAAWFLDNYEMTSYEYTADSADGGNANIIGGDGDITNGESKTESPQD